MSNETDLDFLARNVHVWDECSYAAMCGGVERVMWISGAAYGQKSEFKNAVTKDQWLARRAELQNKPSWSGSPEWAQFLCQDEDGVWYWHGERPNEKGEDVNGKRYWMSRRISDIACRGELIDDWRDTLERRPEQFKPSIEEANRLAQEFKQFTSIEDNQEQVMSQKQEMKLDSGWFERGELPPIGVWCEASCDGADPEMQSPCLPQAAGGCTVEPVQPRLP